MGYLSKFLGVTAAVVFLSVSVVGAEERDPLKPRVPPDQAAAADNECGRGRHESRVVRW